MSNMIKSIFFCLVSILVFMTPLQIQAAVDNAASEKLNAFVLKQVKDLIDINKQSVDFTHKKWGERNPFEGSVSGGFVSSAALPAVNVDLQGIFLGGQKSSAIIDGAVVGVGDTIKGWTVKEIKEGSVVVANSSGKENLLTMKVDLSSHTDGSNKEQNKGPIDLSIVPTTKISSNMHRSVPVAVIRKPYTQTPSAN